MPDRPPMVRTDVTNAFAHNTMKVRVPAIIREVQALNPEYSPSIQAALSRLAESMENNQPIPMIDPLSPDYEMWAACFAPYAGDTWLNTDWFFAEVYCYRLLMQAVRWWETGRDPFAPKKEAEIGSAGLWTLLEKALAPEGETPEQKLKRLIQDDLWGNRIDLSFAAAQAHGTSVGSDDLLVDDSEAVVQHILSSSGDFHLIADNTGTELAMDLVLIDALLTQPDNRVFLHLKMHPTFVSDATVPDVRHLTEKIMVHPRPTVQALGVRLERAFQDGRLRFAPDLYWNSTRVLEDMPTHLVNVFHSAILTIIKGDANYRRMVADRLWSPSTPYAFVTSYFPSPLLALRTLKSDMIVGLPSGMAERLDSEDPQWRINGRRGLIQFRP
ncbi:MAG: damage-control phosphatase ARMT1 family protein [Chloroflexota bacterium]